MTAVVLLPTYNERDNLAAITTAILNNAPVDILILDDNSPDGTGKIADQLALQNSRIRVMHRPEKQGLGRAYLDGFKHALQLGYEYIFEMDADFSHPPEKLNTMLTLAKTHHLVIGSRWVKGGKTQNWSFMRQLISRAGSLYARTLLNVDIRDMTAGFRCYQRCVLEKLDLRNVRSNGYAFQIEMTYRTIKEGFSVNETPITFVERRVGASKMSRKIIAEAIWRVPQLKFERSLRENL